MDARTYDLLYGIPEQADYAVNAGDLDPEDIPKDRVDAVLGLLRHARGEKRFLAAKLLTSWGVYEGLCVLEKCMEKPKGIEGMYAHHLHGYDDTYRQIILAVTRYFSNVADRGQAEEARIQIYPLLSKIINLANREPFEITKIFDFANSESYSEYVPLVEEHLAAIIDSPEIHGWKVYDAICFLVGFDSDFVASILRDKKKSIDDFMPAARGK